MKKVTMQWAFDNRNLINLIDVRTPAEYQVKSIKGAKNFPMKELIENPDYFLDKEKTYYLYCGSGGRSQVTAEKLLQKNFDVIQCDGGIRSLKLD